MLLNDFDPTVHLSPHQIVIKIWRTGGGEGLSKIGGSFHLVEDLLIKPDLDFVMSIRKKCSFRFKKKSFEIKL